MGIGPIDRNKRIPELSQIEAESVKKHSTRRRQKKDRLQISEESRRIQAADVQKKNSAERAEALRNEKLRAVRRRIADSFYERPDIKGKLAEILSGDEDILTPAEAEVGSASSGNIDKEGPVNSIDEEESDQSQNQPPPDPEI
jgi:hypothetical protein